MASARRTYASASDCREAGADWERDLATQPGHRGGHFTAVVFLEGEAVGGGDICYFGNNRDYGVVGDPIYVAVFTSDKVKWRSVRYDPCALQSAAPNILQSSDKFPTAALQNERWTLQQFPERRCFNTAVDLSIVGLSPGNVSVSQHFPLQQYDRYRATLQLGVLFTPQHDNSFALRRDQADTSQSFVYNQGPTDKGPEYVASLVLYSFLRYIPSLFGRRDGRGEPYAGRDVIHDQSFADRLGAVLGVGISNPAERFIAGGSFELLYGVSVMGVWDFARVHELAGVSTTEPFLGTADEIPTRTVWNSRFTGGLSIDLRYASTLFTGNR